MFWILVACGPDPEVARLSAEVEALKARVDELEARPASLDLGAVLQQVAGDLGVDAELVPSEATGPVPLPLSVLSDAATFASCRVLLHRGPDGEYDGYRLSAIRRGSVADLAGLKNGDIVSAVQDLPLRSMADGTALLEALLADRPSEVRVALRRRGEPVILTIPVAPEGTPLPTLAVEPTEPDPERDARREAIRQRLEARRAARALEDPPAP